MLAIHFITSLLISLPTSLKKHLNGQEKKLTYYTLMITKVALQILPIGMRNHFTSLILRKTFLNLLQGSIWKMKRMNHFRLSMSVMLVK
jgi:hypothetical protein